jgi:hypothetical protein
MVESAEAIQLREACLMACPNPAGIIKFNDYPLDKTLKTLGFDFLTTTDEL